MDISAIGRRFGLDPQQTEAAISALAPVVTAGLRRNAQFEGGLSDLIGALAGGGHARYADDTAALAAPGTVDDGNAILGHVFGSKDVSRGVAQQLSATSGIGEQMLKKLLPIVAAMVMGQIAKRTGSGSASGGGLGDILGSILGGGASGQPQGGGLGDIIGGMLGGQSEDDAPRRRSAPSSGGLNDILGELLGGGNSGNRSAADDLLNSVQQAIRNR